MSSNKGQLCRDGIFGNLQIKSSVVVDKDRNLKNINDARIRGNLRIDGCTDTVLRDLTGWTLYEKVVDATVSIFNSQTLGTCSGWFVSADGWVATAAHCVLNGNSRDTGTFPLDALHITVLNVNGAEGDKRAFNPSIIVVDGAADYALMKIDGIENQNYLEWGDIDEECNGNRCYVVGNPLGFDHMSVADGIIRDKQFITDGCIGGNYNATENVMLSVPTFQGNSGSPIINEKCKVIGQLQWGPFNGEDPAETIGGGTSVRFLKPVTEQMIMSSANYTNKGYLGFEPWWPLTASNAVGIGLSPAITNLNGIVVCVKDISPALTPVAGPALPEGTIFDSNNCNYLVAGEPINENMVVITEIDGVPVGNDKNHISSVTWFKSSGQTVVLKWYYPPSTTIQTTEVTLESYPASEDGFGMGSLSQKMRIAAIPPMIGGEQDSSALALKELLDGTYATRGYLTQPEHLARVSAPDYADGFSAPSGAGRPNPRAISNAVFAGPGGLGIPNPDALTDYFWLWGQFLDHDIDLTPDNSGESFNIPVPTGDPDFDPGSTGTVEIPLHRSVFDPATGTTNAREQLNHITAFIDATNVYGSTESRAIWLRSFMGGKLKIISGGLPPLNDGSQPNAVSPLGSAPFVVGDVRGNEQPLLLSMHTVLHREHNRWCDLIATQDPSLSDEQIYQKARVMVESIVQNITWFEFLPLLLGSSALPPYTGYHAATDTRVATEFSTAAYRLGHSLVSDTLWRLQPNGDPSPLGHLNLKDAFFAPHTFTNAGGMDPLLLGASEHICQKLDSKIVPALRNFLFGPPGAGGLDLAALNIQRGRDHGIADYNTVRVAIGLPARATFAEITSDAAVQAALSSAYSGDISKVDLWVGGLAEDHVSGSQLGQTFQKIVRDQFVRLRDGDELWFENRLSPLLQNYVKNIKLADVIKANTSITGMRANAMQVHMLSSP